jgi:SLOG family YspA-like protein
VSAQKPFRILVTGSRRTTYSDNVFIRSKLEAASAPARVAGRKVVIVEGRCPVGGVDLAAQRWAEGQDSDVVNEGHVANWGSSGRAGPERNAAMVAAGADLCLAFPRIGQSWGTWDCIRKAAEAGIPVRIWPL